MIKLKCHHCDYEWECNSKLLYVTCPSCRLKVENRQITTPKDKLIKGNKLKMSDKTENKTQLISQSLKR